MSLSFKKQGGFRFKNYLFSNELNQFQIPINFEVFLGINSVFDFFLFFF